MAFLGQHDILVLEKNNGTVRRIVNGVSLSNPLLDVAVASKDERGLLGIAIAKDEAKKVNYVFLYFTESASGVDGDDVTNKTEPLGDRLYRYELIDNQLVRPKLLLDVPAVTQSKYAFHNGGKILIGPDKNVYLGIGNMEHNTKAENNKTGLPPDGTGGILQLKQNGEPTLDDILGKKFPLNLYYAYGIRNSFGMDFDPVTGNLWDTENGPSYGDEINLVRPGFNSGAKIFYGVIDNQIGNNTQPNKLVYFGGKGKYSDPEFEWNQTVGPTALKFLNSTKLGKQYENTMFVGDINNGNLYNFKLDKERKHLLLEPPLDDRKANSPSELESVIFGQGFGGITDLQVGPDGYIYVLAIKTFHNDYRGTIYRIVLKAP
jgi:glucose/arabinose dehydrogenase